jgi:hypothetical protein
LFSNVLSAIADFAAEMTTFGISFGGKKNVAEIATFSNDESAT